LPRADQAGPRKAVLQVAHERVRVVPKQDCAHAFVGRRDQDRAERALADRKADRGSVPAAAELRRGHAEEIGRGGIEAPAGVEPGAVDRFGDRGTLRELVAYTLGAMGVGIGLRRHAGDRLEHTVKVKAAHASGPGERIEIRRLFRLLDHPAGIGHR
jgi:hypothetical protein